MNGYLLDTNVLVLTMAEIEKGLRLLPESKRRSQIELWFEEELKTWFAGRILRRCARKTVASHRLTDRSYRLGARLDVSHKEPEGFRRIGSPVVESLGVTLWPSRVRLFHGPDADEDFSGAALSGGDKQGAGEPGVAGTSGLELWGCAEVVERRVHGLAGGEALHDFRRAGAETTVADCDVVAVLRANHVTRFEFRQSV